MVNILLDNVMEEHNFKCFICGNNTFIAIKGTTIREAVCEVCRASKRNSDVALAILKVLGFYEDYTLKEIANYLKHLSIYEAQASGAIHNTLSHLPNYVCSEYFDDMESGTLHQSGVGCESLQNLSFMDNSLDLIITQDILEHVADPDKAFDEIYRVLKPTGSHIFTVPLHEDRATTTRAKVENGEVIHKHAPVHHLDGLRPEGILVFTDWGDDIVEYLESRGMPTHVAVHNIFYNPDVIPHITNENAYLRYIEFTHSNDTIDILKYFLDCL